MSLYSRGGRSDGVNYGDHSDYQSLQAWSMGFWVRQVGWEPYSGLFQKGVTGEKDRQGELNGDSGNGAIRILIRRITSGDQLEVSSFFATLDKEYFVFITYDAAASSGSRIKLYRGDLSTAPTNTNSGGTGSGTVADDGEDLRIMRMEAINKSMNGAVSWFGHWDRVLTLGEIVVQWYRRHKSSGCVIFSEFGYSGLTTQVDWSGLDHPGTIEDGGDFSIGDHAPIPVVFANGDYFDHGAATVVTPSVDRWHPLQSQPLIGKPEVVAY